MSLLIEPINFEPVKKKFVLRTKAPKKVLKKGFKAPNKFFSYRIIN